MINKYSVLLFVFILLPVLSSAQNNVAFNQLTVENGLSQSSVTCILQDRKGFMWFGTQDGLNRYDGYTFKVFKNIADDPKSLSDNFIFSIYEEDSGNLIIETQSGKLNKYDPLTESFTIISSDSIDLRASKRNSVLAFYYDRGNIAWSGGLSRETGLRMENKTSGEVKNFLNDPADKFSLSDNKVYSILRDKNGNLWVGTFNGLNKFDEKTGRFYHYKNNPTDHTSISDNWIWPIFEDSKGNLWIGTVRGGLNKFDPNTGVFTTYKNDPANPKSINDNFIFSIYEDRSGLIWVGTNTGGVNYFNPAAQVFEHFYNIPDQKNTLADNSVMSLHVDRKGIYWIGTRNGGLDIFDYQQKRFTNYSHSPINKNSLINNSVSVIYEDRSGLLWLGTFNSGLNSFNPQTNTFTAYVHDPEDSNTITDNRIYSIIEDKDGIIWIGTYGGGLNKLEKESGRVTNYQADENDSTSISSNSVWSVIDDDAGKLWIGTFGGGVNAFDKSSQMFTHFRNNPDDPNSLIDDSIIRVFKDTKGNLWFGTTKGLSRYLSESRKFKSYSEKDGLANNFVYGILEDDNGNLWLSTNYGISKFDPVNETFKNYYVEDGLQNNEFNQNAFAKDFKTGNLLFGGVNGFNVFNPEHVKGNTYIPRISFTNYLRYNTDDEEGKPIIEKGISVTEEISLTYKDNIVTFEFAALSFYNNFKNHYRYKLEGFNENWIQLGNNNKVTFTNLSPGDYVLRVIGSNNDGVWNEEGASLLIHVSPPWWKTNFAYATYFIIFFGILYGLRRYEINRREQKAQLRESALRIKATEAEKRALEIENERKTKELEEARQLQLSMLPKKLPVLPNFEIAAFMRTATEVGGDYYDFRVNENGELYVAFGDATGHGLQAGTMVTLMKGFFTSDSSKLGMQEFMNHCSRMIKEIELGRILMSFSYLKFENNKVHITSAGMPPVFFYNSISKEIEEIIIQGMPLGAMKNFPYKVIEKEINSGDTILLLSDGLPEQMNSKEEMFDYERVKNNFLGSLNQNPNEIISNLVKAGDEWMNGTLQEDDITFTVIKIK
ncbi:MAG TPA: two-component regulator propeller domain-containing protein [Ignavibacteriaceae bacterium]|nr:two-component regulator propeller domain-containing protein [Ignavibacteriaceae bacterium]